MRGGGLYSQGAAMHVRDSKVAWNRASLIGGGLCGQLYCNISLRDTSVFANFAAYHGAGLYAADCDMDVRASVVRNNEVHTKTLGGSFGGPRSRILRLLSRRGASAPPPTKEDRINGPSGCVGMDLLPRHTQS